MEQKEFKEKHLDEAAIFGAASRLKDTHVYINPQVDTPEGTVEFCDLLFVGQKYTMIVSLKHANTQENESQLKKNIFSKQKFLNKSHNQLAEHAYKNLHCNIHAINNACAIDIRPTNNIMYVTAIGELLYSDKQDINGGQTVYKTESDELITKDIKNLVIKRMSDGYKCYWGVGSDKDKYYYETTNHSDVKEWIMTYSELLDILCIESDTIFNSVDKIGQLLNWSTTYFKMPYIQNLFLLETLYSRVLRGIDIDATWYVIIMSKKEGTLKINRNGCVQGRNCAPPIVTESRRFMEVKTLLNLTNKWDIAKTMLELLRTEGEPDKFKDTIHALDAVINGGTRDTTIFIVCNKKIYQL